MKTPMLISTLLLAALAFQGCEIVDCVRHSDCPDDKMCGGGECITPGDTEGGTESDGDEGGPSTCQGYTFEPPAYTIADWECIAEPLNFPLSDLTITPIYTTGDYAEALDLHTTGVCGFGGSPTPGWATARQGLAESVFQQCMPSLLGSGVPACVDQAESICTAQSAAYFQTIGSVPPLMRVQGLLVDNFGGPCEGPAEFPCSGGADSSTGG